MKKLIHSSEYISAMAYERQKILQKAFSYSDRIAEHVMKCVIYSRDYKDYNHWIDDELSTWFYDINVMKPKGGKIKPQDYRRQLFSGFGDERSDTKLDLQRFHREFVERHPNPFPDFNITAKLTNTLFNAVNTLAENITPKMGQYSNSDDIREILHSVLDEYCVPGDWLIT